MDIWNQLLQGFATAGTPVNLMWAFVGCALGTAVGVLPVLTWQAPDTGAPDRYRVTVMQIRRGLYDIAVATFDTTEAQLQVPPGVLKVGQPVYFIVRALQGVGPLTPGTPQGWADTFTDIITP